MILHQILIILNFAQNTGLYAYCLTEVGLIVDPLPRGPVTLLSIIFFYRLLVFIYQVIPGGGVQQKNIHPVLSK